MAQTYGDIRARFQLAMDLTLNEAARTIEGTVLPAMEKILGSGDFGATYSLATEIYPGSSSESAMSVVLY